ncbi:MULTISPECIES: hypothetical protein [Paenibacillus]|uniref:Uncharacterized protein n=1 Tax=Paenibacillus albilobatus TaxID=2716884 RepID=A0A919XNG3_9BACL|nr:MULTISPECIES: hypothetical protein [Paenibacillus]GIO33605.1 hypothetical protein J2TS6_47460 [Paenibacillus albilobatus]
MTTRELIKENNRLREQMTPANRDFYEDIVVYVRVSRAEQLRGEQRLLELAHEVAGGAAKGNFGIRAFWRRCGGLCPIGG